MSPPSRTSPTPATERQLAITGALAAERLMEVHFRYAAELVEHSVDQLEPARALAIYARLHGLKGVDAETLLHRVLVSLGRRDEKKLSASVDSDAQGARLPESPRSLLAVIRRRLRGRVNIELREWVEFHTGRTETELLWAHVENALQFVELYGPSRDVGEAVTRYAAEMDLSPARTETVYYLTLAHLSGNPLVSNPGDSSSEDELPNDGGSSTHRPLLRITNLEAKTGRRQVG